MRIQGTSFAMSTRRTHHIQKAWSYLASLRMLLHLIVTLTELNAGPPPAIQYNGKLEKYCYQANEVKLYRHHVDALFAMFWHKRPYINYYICTVNKAFAKPGQRMVMSFLPLHKYQPFYLLMPRNLTTYLVNSMKYSLQLIFYSEDYILLKNVQASNCISTSPRATILITLVHTTVKLSMNRHN